MQDYKYLSKHLFLLYTKDKLILFAYLYLAYML